MCLGSIAQNLGLLCTVTSAWQQGEAHFRAALDLNARIGARPALAHTQYRYAEMLVARGEHGDREQATELLAAAAGTASELGMKRLLEDVTAMSATRGRQTA